MVGTTASASVRSGSTATANVRGGVRGLTSTTKKVYICNAYLQCIMRCRNYLQRTLRCIKYLQRSCTNSNCVADLSELFFKNTAAVSSDSQYNLYSTIIFYKTHHKQIKQYTQM